MSRDERIAATAEEILQGLTPSQREAVEQIEGPQLILAGPGSGKTRVVTHRIANMLLAGIPDDQILALTFTNKAADEMRQRVARLCPDQQVWMGTFHRFCSRQLRQYAPLVGLRENFTIYDTDDSLKLLREAIHDAEVHLIHETPAKIAAAISGAKNDLIRPEVYRGSGGPTAGRAGQTHLSPLSTASAVGQRRRLRRSADALRADLAGQSGPARGPG